MRRLIAGWFDLIVPVALGALPEGLGLITPGPGTWTLSTVVAAGLVGGVPEGLFGRSIGLAIVSLRVGHDPDGAPIGWSQAFIRWVVRWIPLAVVVLLDLPLWWIAVYWLVLILPSVVDGQHRALHDRLSGSLVTAAPRSKLLRGDTVEGVGFFQRWHT